MPRRHAAVIPMMRVLAFSALLVTGGVALGGVATPDPIPDAAAECGQLALGDDPCPPSVGCVVAAVTERATGIETVCTM